jgi:PAS domain S-box-containing protein
MKRMNYRYAFSQFIFIFSSIALLFPLVGAILVYTGIINFTEINHNTFIPIFLVVYFSITFLFLLQLKSKLAIPLRNLLLGSGLPYKKEIETRLFNSEDKFRKILDNANDAIFLWRINESADEVEKLIYVNKTAIDMLGFSREEIQKMLPHDFIIEEKRSKAPLALKKLFAEGSARFETIFHKKNGERLDVEIDSRCFNLINEKVLLSIIRDISQRKMIEEAHRLIKFCVDNASLGIIRTDANAKIIEANSYVCNLLEYSKNEICQKLIFEINPGYTKELWGKHLNTLNENDNNTYETELITKNGKRIPVDITNTLIMYNDKKYLCSFIRDITEIFKSRTELKHREHFLSAAQKIAKFGYYIYDYSTKSWECSEEINDILGIDKIFGKAFENLLSIIEPEQHAEFMNSIDAFLKQKDENFENEFRIVRKNDSQKRWIHLLGKVEYDNNKNQKYIIGTIQDVTDRRISENNLKESLHEKEILLKEIHHRVKNNLQIVSSLLFLQSQQLKNEELVELFKISQNRVRTMALIHEKLYQSEDLNKIDFGQYISSLILALKESFSVDESKINIDVKTDNILLDIDIAVPCGLIVNELITNSIKHAFKKDGRGVITINAKYENENYYLIIGDNGVGLPDNIKIEELQALGLRIVYNLVRQLRGELKVENNDGTKFIIIFPKMV